MPHRLVSGAGALLATGWFAVASCAQAPGPSGAGIGRLAPSPPGPVAAVTGEVRVQPQRATIGDPLLLTVSVQVPPGCTVVPPRVEARLGPFQVVSRETAPAGAVTGAGRLEEWRYRIVPWSTGALQVPPVVVDWQDGTGKAGVWRSLPVGVTVVSVLKEGETEIAGLKPPEPIPDDWTWTVVILAALALLLAGLVGLALLLSRRRRRKEEAAKEPPLPAHEKALRRLRAMETDCPPPPEKTKPFYVELSEALREYVEGRWSVEALERTTTELRFEMRRARLPGELGESLLAILSAADLAKFARFVPPPEETTGHLREAVGIVERTIPRTEETPGSAVRAGVEGGGEAA